MVGGGKMTVIIAAAIIALPVAWAISKIVDYYTMKDVIFEMEEEEEADK